ncbi:MAG: MFS transporter [Erysipelotrichaceae bacterium]|nr:MFS transporter [Erysipelotrichaceae bacterium]
MSEKNKGFNPNSMNFGGKGWLFCLFAAIAFFVPTCLGSAWQMAVQYWEAAYGWDRTFILTMSTIGGLLTVVTAFLVSALALKKSPRKISIVLVIIYIALLFIVGASKSLPLTCLCIILIAAVGSNWCYNVNPIIIANWFPRKKGLVMGLVTMGIPLAAGLTTRIIAAAHERFGMSLMFIPYIIMAAVALLFLLFFVKDNPEEANFNPDNDRSMTTEQAQEMNRIALEADKNSPWTRSRVLKTKEVWIIALAMGVQLLYAGGVMSQMILAFMGRGYEMSRAANLMLTTALFAVLGSWLMGYVDNFLGPRRAIQLTYLIGAAGCALLIWAPGSLLYVGLFLIGSTVGGAANFSASLCASYWGRYNFKRAYGVIQPIIQIVGAFAPAFMAQLAKFPGGYNVSYIGLIVMMILGLIVFSTVKDGSFVQRREAEFAEEDNKQ